jgi:type I restriction enzyme S subunit
MKPKVFLKLEINLPDLKTQIEIRNKLKHKIVQVNTFSEVQNISLEDVSKLRQSILQQAVQGKLVSQDPKDEPASEFLKKIKAEKERLIKEGKIKKDKPFAPISEDEIPYKLPEGWEWVRLGEILEFINGDRGKNYPSKEKLSNEGIPFISAINMQDGGIRADNLLCVSERQFNKLNSGKLRKNDTVFCIRGSLGKSCVYPLEEGAIASSLVILRQFNFSNIFSKYLNIYINSPLLFQEIRKYDNGTAQPNLAANDFKKFVFPLLPLSEQKRIVEKVDNLMAYCDELEKQVKENQENTEKLLSAVLKEGFEDG